MQFGRSFSVLWRKMDLNGVNVDSGCPELDARIEEWLKWDKVSKI